MGAIHGPWAEGGGVTFALKGHEVELQSSVLD